MATEFHNLSSYDANSIPDGTGMRIGIVVSGWNSHITNKLLEGAYETLLKFGVKADDIVVEYVPGSIELTYGGKTADRGDRCSCRNSIGLCYSGRNASILPMFAKVSLMELPNSISNTTFP